MTPLLRLTVLHSLVLLAGSVIAQAAPASPEPSTPAQFWASNHGVINLRPPLSPFTADQVADQLAIKDCFERWGIAYDEGRLEVIRSLFTEDGIYSVVTAQEAPPKEVAHAVGPQAIAALVEKVLKFQRDQRRHVITNILVNRTSPDAATAMAYGSVTVASNGLKMGASVIYTAELQRQPDGFWRFKRFVIGMDDYLGSRPENAR
jgi:hypothetical protein